MDGDSVLKKDILFDNHIIEKTTSTSSMRFSIIRLLDKVVRESSQQQ